MKVLLYTLVFAAVACDIGCTRVPVTQRAQLLDNVVRRARAADFIEIIDLCPGPEIESTVMKDGVIVSTKVSVPITRVALTRKEKIERIVANLKLSEERLTPGVEFITPDGKKVVGYPPCLCDGDFSCRFLKNSQELVQITVFHRGEFVRVGSGKSSSDFDLVPPFGSKLNGEIKTAFTEANQALLPTPTSVTDRADARSAPAVGAADL